MNLRRITALVSIILFIFVNMAFQVFAVTMPNSYITIEFDKDTAKEGEIIKASVKVKNITAFAGFQFALKFDPEILQAVDPITGKPYTNSDNLADGDILKNQEYMPLKVGRHSLENGIINYGNAYVQMPQYKMANKPETTGTIATIGFKVLKEKPAKVRFEKVPTLENTTTGTMLFNWDMKDIKKGYSIVQPKTLNPGSETATQDIIEAKEEDTIIKTKAPEVMDNQSNNLPGSNTQTNGTETKKDNSTLIVVILVVIVVIIVGVIIAVVMRKRGDSDDSSAHTAEDKNQFDDNEEDEI